MLSLFPSLPFSLPGILPLQMQVCGSISSLPKETESFMNILHPVLEKWVCVFSLEHWCWKQCFAQLWISSFVGSRWWLQSMASGVSRAMWCWSCLAFLSPCCPGQHVKVLPRPLQDILWETWLRSYQPLNLQSTGDCWTVTGHAPHCVGWHSDGVGTNGVWDVCAQPAPPCAGCSNVKSCVVWKFQRDGKERKDRK